jgi:NDP-sugar pyrophosphorylase family protein
MSVPDRAGLTAVVLAAGFGTRFLPLTRSIPKPALPFLNRPILHWVFDALRASGVERALLNLHHLPDAVRGVAEAYGGGFGLDFSLEPEILGTAGLYNPLRDRLPDLFLAANADLWFDGDLSPLLHDLHAHPESHASLGVLPRPEGMRYTGLDVQGDGTLRAFGRGGWMFTGLYAVRRRILDHLPREGFLELVKDLLVPALESGLIRAVPLRGAWADLGSPGEYLRETARALQAVAGGCGPTIPAGCRLETRDGFPVLLHRTAHLDAKARVTGPLVLGEGCSVEAEAEAGNAVLLSGAHLGRGDSLNRALLDAGGLVCQAP